MEHHADASDLAAGRAILLYYCNVAVLMGEGFRKSFELKASNPTNPIGAQEYSLFSQLDVKLVMSIKILIYG